MKHKEPLSFRLEPALHGRLDECARRLRLKKYTLGLLAIEAAVEAIERNNYKLVVPIEFEVAQLPSPAPARYPAHRAEVSLAEDSSSSKGISDKTRKKIQAAAGQAAQNVAPKTPKAP